MKRKDIVGPVTTEFDSVAQLEEMVINCDHIVRIDSFILTDEENKGKHALVLRMSNKTRVIINEDTIIETNSDVIKYYHKNIRIGI